MKLERRDYLDSIRRLKELGLLGPDESPILAVRIPQPEDEGPLGVCFYRTFLSDGADLSNLTLPRTFFGRSEIRDASFRNTDLTESNLRWNDFIDVDFTEAILTRADLRASQYTRVNFACADLRGADLRRSDFEDCVFDGALMEGALLARNQGSRLSLSAAQKTAIAWGDDGPQPSGG